MPSLGERVGDSVKNAFAFGSYFPGDSIVHRLDPRAKMLLAFAFIATALNAHGTAGLAVCALFVLGSYAFAHLPLGKALRSILPLCAIVVVAAGLNLFVVQGGEVLLDWGFVRVSEAGMASCALIAARLVLMLMAMSLVTMTTTSLDLTEAFERLLSPLARFGLPAHELAMMMGIALRFLPQFAQELVTVYRAQISRGARTLEGRGSIRMLASLLVPLFTSAFRRAETLSSAMEARCYHGGVGRTRLDPLSFSARDAFACAAVASLAACVVVANSLG